MSVERVERKDGTVVWRVRWRQGGRNRSKVLGRKRDAEAFDAELVRKKRTGCTPSRTSRSRRSRSTRCSGTRTCCRGSGRYRCVS
jgi:ribosomal protein L15E